MPIVQCPSPSNHPGQVHKGHYFLALIRADDLHPESDIAGNALDIAEPIQLLAGCCKANSATSVPAGSLAGQLSKSRIERIAVVMNLRHAVVADETGALAGGMPGRTGGQLALFNQDAIVPSLNGQVI